VTVSEMLGHYITGKSALLVIITIYRCHIARETVSSYTQTQQY